MKGGREEVVSNIILQEIVKLGFKNRGVKDGIKLFVINRTVMPAVLIECAFCDSPKAMGNHDTQKMTEAIFTGVCKAFAIPNVNDPAAVYNTVVKGDTLWGLSRKYGVSLNSIVALNEIRVANVILIGEKIRIK